MAGKAATRITKSPWGRDKDAEREEKREALLHAAAQAFAAKGYFRTSLDDIAERLGVSKPTLYYYAKNKEDLIAAVAARAQEQMLSPIAVDPHAPAIATLRAYLRRYCEIIVGDFGRCFALLSDTDLTPETGANLRRGKHLIDKRLRELIASGIADGSVAPCDPKMAAFMLAGAMNGIAKWFSDDGAHDAATVAEIFVNLMAAGLEPRQ